MEEVDIAFNDWFNREQPLEKIVKETGTHVLRHEEALAIRRQIKAAFTHAYARGVAAEVAKQNLTES